MTRPLTVLSVAYPFSPVGPDAVGGAEQVLSAIDRALVREGHRSIVIACEGSRAAGELIATPLPDGPSIDDGARARIHAAVRAAIAEVIGDRRVDVVHMHGVDFGSYYRESGPPTLITVHLPPAWYSPEVLRVPRRNTWMHAVSWSQDGVLRTVVDGTPILPPILNGVPVAAFERAHHARRCFALMLGRICPEKGYHLGLDAARSAGVPVLLAGSVFPYAAHELYFRTDIMPRLDRLRLWIGPVDFARKRRLLAAARCVLIPSLAPETSSLVAMEAAACGTPGIAFDSGALGEIVLDGRTGFLVRNGTEMADAIGCVSVIKRDVCREIARRNFSQEAMTAAYVARYHHLATAPVST